jgi:hypothetical protein
MASSKDSPLLRQIFPNPFVRERKMVSMTVASVDIVLDNDRVVVRRIKRSGPGPVSSGKRGDRLVIYLKDARITRTEGGRHEDIRRRAGDVVWRPASEHEIELIEGDEHEILVVEFKS